MLRSPASLPENFLLLFFTFLLIHSPYQLRTFAANLLQLLSQQTDDGNNVLTKYLRYDLWLLFLSFRST